MAHLPLGNRIHSRHAFTLIELLVVIAIIAILAVVVVLTLNPAQLLAQSRDANRVSDMATLNSAISFYQTDQAGTSGYSLGSASTSYISVPSSASNCSTLGMASSAYAWGCSSSNRSTNATGWVPVNFANISAGAPFGSLPVDPTNQTSSNLYYSYETDGSKYALSSFMESSKYAKNMQTTGGIDPALYTLGSGANTLPDASRGLVGYWPLSEGTGSSTIDWSGYGDSGVWFGTQAGTNGYYSTGKTSQWGAYFNGVDDGITLAPTYFPNTLSSFTFTAWVNILPTSTSTSAFAAFTNNGGSSDNLKVIGWSSTGGLLCFWGNADDLCSSLAIPFSGWHFVSESYVGGSRSITFYVDNVSQQGVIPAPLVSGSMTGASLGSLGSGWYFDGELNDVRLYDRALSAVEIQEIYNAEK